MAGSKEWLIAARLRTLPLALSSIGVGGGLAYYLGRFNPVVFVLCITTTLFLQILSNFANDYGDYVHGADSNERQGPVRMVQSGVITKSSMQKAMALMGFLSLCSGILLLYLAIPQINWLFLLFLLLGIASIVSAIKYTAGSNPYGYMGLGDVFVFLFFGPVAVLGTCFLQSLSLPVDFWMPSVSMGLFSTGVLNVNNIRDIESDKEAGKLSIPVRIGSQKAKIYHTLIISIALFLAFLFLFQNNVGFWVFLPVISLPFFIVNVVTVWKRNGKDLDSMLKQLVLSILLFTILFVAVLVLK